MIKQILTLAILGAAIISNTGCKNDSGFKKLKGIEYKIIKDVPGPTAKIGDIIEFNIVAKVDTQVLGDSRKQQNGKPAVGRVDSIKGSGQFQAIFPLLSVGDSAIVYVSCDTLIKTIPADRLEMVQKQQTWLRKGKKIFVTISIVGIKSMEAYQKEMQEEQAKMQEEMKQKEEAQKPIDDKLIQDYLAKNNIKAQKTASGLYYTITKPGSGPQIMAGQIVSMKYTGKTLDGKVFDSNVDTAVSHHGEPLTFAVGQHQMIPGMDEGAALLKKGSKATLFLPSPLGYGAQAQGNIAANSVLIFDVEVTDVKAAPKPAPATAPAPPQSN